MGPNRFQCWWFSEVLGRCVDAYPTPGQAQARLEEVKQREHFTRGLVIDIEECMAGTDAYRSQAEHTEHHKQFTEETTHA